MKTFSEARALIGGLKGVMRKLGDDPQHEHKWKSMPKCPFCLNKDCAGIFNKGGVDYFKCHKPGCSSGGAVLTEVTYIALREGLDDAKQPSGPSPAYKRFLELANCWEEPADPANKKEKSKPVEKPVRPNPVKVKPLETVPPPSPIAPPVLPNPVLPPSVESPLTPALSPDGGEGEDKSDEEELIAKCIEVVRAENKASVRSFQRHFNLGHSRASRIMDELEKRGVVGPAKGTEPREILKLPDAPAGLITIKLGDEIHIEDTTKRAAAGGPLTAAVSPGAGEGGKKTEEKAQAGPAKLPLGQAALMAFFGKLYPTESQMAAFLEGVIYLCDKCGFLRTASLQPAAMQTATICQKCSVAMRLIDRVPDPLPSAVAKKLKFRPVSLFEKRRITSLSCEVLGLRANPSGNEAFLHEVKEEFPWEEVRASGLWLEADRKRKLGRRPNAQFHGKGQIGRKPERERRGKDDKWVWGFCDPVLIPYFDEAGDLIKLRPHKGGAPAGTFSGRPRIYVPRAYKSCADMVEKFSTVYVCEGEYKAIAIWQTIGLGAKLQVDADGKPLIDANRHEAVGVCALPGISYVTNVEMYEELKNWLRSVKVPGRQLRVNIAFDDEDKSDKPLRQRFDALRDARVLAIKLSKDIHVNARVCMLPREWRNAQGKADWDGALVKITSETSNIQHPTLKTNEP